jgi:kynurenine formamidase
MLSSLVLALLWSSSGGERVVDLGHVLAPESPSWSGEKVFERTETGTGGVSMGRFRSDEHFGTHLDAPSHFAPGKWTVDQIPPERLVGPGYCIHIEAQAAGNEDYRMTLEDVKAFEAKEGQIPAGAIVLVATGWDRRWAVPARYMNAREGVMHFPGITVEAAAYLARDRKVAGIGIDTPSVDYGPSQKYETHHTTMPLNVYHVENAARLTELPAKGFTVVVAPIKIAGGSGGPTRVYALVP